jgi:hypothetical protein
MAENITEHIVTRGTKAVRFSLSLSDGHWQLDCPKLGLSVDLSTERPPGAPAKAPVTEPQAIAAGTAIVKAHRSES